MEVSRAVRLAGVALLWNGGLFVAGPWAAARLHDVGDVARWEVPAGPLIGLALIVAGAAALAWCGRAFRVHGEGTPVPTDPPQRLVEIGLYRYSRNPIFVANVAILIGIAAWRGEVLQLGWAALVALGLHVWVCAIEEPRLVQRFGEAWGAYVRRVPRWMGWPQPG